MVLLVIRNRRGNEHPRTCAPADTCTVVHPFDGFSARQFPPDKIQKARRHISCEAESPEDSEALLRAQGSLNCLRRGPAM